MESHRRFPKAIEEVNAVVAVCNEALIGDEQVNPERDTVAYCRDLHN